MAKQYWFLCAVMILSAGHVNAGSGMTALGVPAAALRIFKDPVTGMEMAYVKGGCYQMGDVFFEERNLESGFDRPEELPVHEVCVDDHYLGKYEVTRGQWRSIMGSNASSISACREDNCPVDNVSWSEVQDFISRLNSRNSGSRYRLPTEAEWEYAARSRGRREKYSGGNEVGSVARYNDNSEYREGSGFSIYPVGTRAPNGLGIYDMSGNVWEMTNDWYGDNYYSASPRKNPTGPSFGPGRALRGGCTGGDAENQRTSRRKPISAYGVDRKASIGFRLLRICWNESKGVCEP